MIRPPAPSTAPGALLAVFALALLCLSGPFALLMVDPGDYVLQPWAWWQADSSAAQLLHLGTAPCLLVAAGLSQLVQPTIDDYVAKAVELLQAPEELLRIKKYLLRNRAKLAVFDAPARTRHLEAAYLAAHRQAAKGLPATHIRVQTGAT